MAENSHFVVSDNKNGENWQEKKKPDSLNCQSL